MKNKTMAVGKTTDQSVVATETRISKKVGNLCGWRFEQTKYTTAYGTVTTIVAVKEKLKLPKAEVSAQSLLDDCDDNHAAYLEYLKEEAYNGTI